MRAVVYDRMRPQSNLRLSLFSMRALRGLALATLMVSLAPLAQQQHRPSSPAKLPTTTAEALDKTKWGLPTDFSSPFNLVILSFARDQQSAVETWLPIAAQVQSATAKVQPWVLPVSAQRDVLYKWWLNSSMRGGLPASESARYTVPLYVNKRQFLKSLEIPSERQIAVLLTDKAGLVLWRSEGTATEQKKASLMDFLRTSHLAQ